MARGKSRYGDVTVTGLGVRTRKTHFRCPLLETESAYTQVRALLSACGKSCGLLAGWCCLLLAGCCCLLLLARAACCLQAAAACCCWLLNRQAAVRNQTNAGAHTLPHRPSSDGGPGGVAGSRRARMPPGGNRTARAHEFGAAHARSTGRSAAQRWTGAHGLEPRTAEKNRSNLVAPCHKKTLGIPQG